MNQQTALRITEFQLLRSFYVQRLHNKNVTNFHKTRQVLERQVPKSNNNRTQLQILKAKGKDQTSRKATPSVNSILIT